jgi:hypothetical protein
VEKIRCEEEEQSIDMSGEEEEYPTYFKTTIYPR